MTMLINSGKLTSTIIVDDFVTQKLSGKTIKIMNSNGKLYAFIRTGVKNMRLPLHRYLTNCPSGMEVDHINGDTLDNRLCNLRVCTHKENQRNQIVKKRVLPRGVFKKRDKNLLLAQITVDLKTKFLGYFNCPAQAHIAYLLARKKYYGAFSIVGK